MRSCTSATALWRRPPRTCTSPVVLQRTGTTTWTRWWRRRWHCSSASSGSEARTSRGRQPRMELWAGTEPTVNRVGDRYIDQTVRTGHQTRLGDLDLIAELGVSAVRYPILWERTAPDGLDKADWQWPDERLGRLRELRLRPIAGLAHHGSGPRGTNLLDSSF